MIYGAVQGVEIPGTSAGDLTFKGLEVFDNGSIVAPSDWGGGGYTSDLQGVSLGGGPNDSFVGDLIHDNGNDEISDSNESDRPNGSLNGLSLISDWLYNSRDNPLYPGNGFTGPASSCLHSDALQLTYGGALQGPMTISHSIWGPLINQGLYASDSCCGSSWTNVTVADSLFVAIRHNIINDNPAHGWTLNDDTLFAEQGGIELPANGANTITNTVKYNGYVAAPDWTGTTSGDVWWLGEPLPGNATNTDPDFAGPVPSATLNSYDSFASSNFTPQCGLCQGSSLHTFHDLMLSIAAMNP
jgi:hypothetical protein